MVTTTTTLPASVARDDANSEEWIEPNAGEADMRSRRVLPTIRFVKEDSAYIVRLFI